METVLRAAVVYLLLMVIFRISGKRTLAQVTTFDLILTLIISEAIQQALVDNDHSLTNAFVLVITLVGIDIILSQLKMHFPGVERIVEGSPIVLVQNGELLQDRMKKERVDKGDILEAARELRGISKIEEIRHAVIEKNGKITIIPRSV